MKKWLLPLSLLLLIGVNSEVAEASYHASTTNSTKQTSLSHHKKVHKASKVKKVKVTKVSVKLKYSTFASRYTYNKTTSLYKPTTTSKSNQSTSTSTTKPATTTTTGSTTNSTSNSASTSVTQFEQKVIELTNAERAKAGLAPLKANTALMATARAKSVDMQNNHYFSHTSPTYGSPFDQMKAKGIAYSAAAENIAMGQTTPAEVVQSWMNSAGHRANILNGTYTDIGVGYAANGHYWTQQFIKAR